MPYFVSHYVIDWSKVTTVEDLKRLIAAMNISFEPNNPNLKDILDLVKEELKHSPGMIPG